MKNLLYKSLFILLLLPTVVNANIDWAGKHSKSKTIKKEFNVVNDALLRINNSFGNINITTNQSNKTTIEVVIKTNGNDLEEVQEKLNDISVEFNATSNLVEAKTIFTKSKSNSWWSWGKNNNINMEINYIISIPITNSVDLNNDYGSITLDKLEGKATINCDYGKITTKELMAKNNVIRFNYTNNSYFEYINSGQIYADYSGYTVAKAKDLDIIADYTKSTIEIAENVSYKCDYGSITINNVNTVDGNGDYLTTRLGNVYKNVKIVADYGSIKIERMTENAGNITIDSDYVGTTIGYDSNYNFQFDIDLEYAALRDTDNFQFTRSNSDSTDKYYQGYYGNANAVNKIKISSDYGSVSFKEQN